MFLFGWVTRLVWSVKDRTVLIGVILLLGGLLIWVSTVEDGRLTRAQWETEFVQQWPDGCQALFKTTDGQLWCGEYLGP